MAGAFARGFSRRIYYSFTLRGNRSLTSSYMLYSAFSRNGKQQEELLDRIPHDGGKHPNFRILKLGSAAVVFAVGGYFLYHSKERRGPIQAKKSSYSHNVNSSLLDATIGGPFRLINHRGQLVTDRDFMGKWTLLYFGYTSCPDFCPEELQKLAQVINEIDKQGKEVLPVFVTIDPERDSIEQIKAYIKEFHPKMVGLMGSVDDIRQVAREYRVYYKKTDEEGSDYLVDHSHSIYLLDMNARPVKVFGREYSAQDLAAYVTKIIEEKAS